MRTTAIFTLILPLLVLGREENKSSPNKALRGAVRLASEGIAPEYELNSKTIDENDGSQTCPTPASFFPNQMYDQFSNSKQSCMSKSEMDLWNIESAAFRLIASQSHRVYQAVQWCAPLERVEGGQPYKFGNLAVHVITLLDTIQQLQLVPQECFDLHTPLRELMMPAASNVTLEYATGFDQGYKPSLEWWEDNFLPTLASAFSCGFTEEDKHEDPSILPNDIREAFPENEVLQQVWRLMKGYLRSPQKQRERVDRQQDFDVSIYVPFMPVPLSRTYLLRHMRTGVPTYMGPSVWYLWHTIAARYADLEQQCGVDMTEVLSNIKVMIGYFGLTHPCPYCRYHFTLRVSRNDQHWRELPQAAKKELTRDGSWTSESSIYPLEYLFMGGPNLEDKLATIVDGNSLMLFFYKIHNAVNSSVHQSFTCKTEERVEEGSFGCQPDGSKVLYHRRDGQVFTSSTRNLGRAWPTASRYQFWLKDGQSAFEKARQELEDAHAALNQLDRDSGTSLREDFWTYGVDRSVSNDDVKAVLDAIDELDQAILNTNLLYTDYALETAPQCQAAKESSKSFVALAAPLPLIDGNFPNAPDVCFAR